MPCALAERCNSGGLLLGELSRLVLNFDLDNLT